MDYRISALPDLHLAYQALTQCDSGHFFFPALLPVEAVRALLSELSDSQYWGLKFCDGTRVRGVPPDLYSSCTTEEVGVHVAKAYAAAEHGFAYLREEWWPLVENPVDPAALPMSAGSLGSQMPRFLEWIRGPEFSNLLQESLRAATSLKVLRLSVERYKAGQFSAFTKGAPRDAQWGFTLDLTPEWTAEWGGLLEFCDFSGSHVNSYVPQFNSLTVYRLGVSRGMSIVTPFAPRARYAVVGYLGSEAHVE